MVKFIEFEEEVPVSEELDADLKIINADLPPAPEDLTSSPFITTPKRKPAFKPEPPKSSDIEIETQMAVHQEENEVIEEETPKETPKGKVKSLKPKKALTEKQKAHLELMRTKKVEKAQAKVNKTLQKNNIVREAQPIAPTEEEMRTMESDEFEAFLKNMDRFDKMVKAVKKEEERKQHEIAQKEKEMEDRIRKKIQLENNQKQNISTPSVPLTSIPVIQQPQEQSFGMYSNMFGY